MSLLLCLIRTALISPNLSRISTFFSYLNFLLSFFLCDFGSPTSATWLSVALIMSFPIQLRFPQNSAAFIPFYGGNFFSPVTLISPNLSHVFDPFCHFDHSFSCGSVFPVPSRLSSILFCIGWCFSPCDLSSPTTATAYPCFCHLNCVFPHAALFSPKLCRIYDPFFGGNFFPLWP